MPRHVTDVVDMILVVVPEGETALRERLEWVKGDAAYRAPEQHQVCWRYLAEALEGGIGMPREDWHRQVVAIMRGDHGRFAVVREEQAGGHLWQVIDTTGVDPRSVPMVKSKADEIAAQSNGAVRP